ncbi:MAG: 23S rRNA (guanosine(2251)-2'-O)-methyltransferase RlmB [Lachnospiraceae bacterium]|jgi:23S rRNA (guanosine2251-2'-O)-methyltransferase|nr:23S rRNA (guanosine(2251)-2'-O)-methyltransferase RlmB [Lachnospiraceae bacterium]
MTDSIIYGRNTVLEAIKAGREIEKLYLSRPPHSGSLIQIAGLAKKKRILIQETDKAKLDTLCDKGNHQGVVALCAASQYAEVADILRRAEEKGEAPFLLICESIQDPHNLGAILRSAEAAGVHGVIISRHHAVGLTEAVAKTAAGALEYMPVAKVASVAKLIEELKQQGIWTACADMDGQSVYQTDLKGPLALIIGGEHEGITRLVKERCDFVVSLPMKGQVTSLNASVAAGILLFEALRQRS